ncbi:hypothetical protein Moror_30 [Moniliophthora roreri MCA 2997]|uniref:Uncharacterized protein n=1 Tax=Moniliophthora roreri (strain MCA 2997) TaxID=1381753 RepID=V2Y0J1_MONRO|nr:hypothetical protein Moror_30 [Moniliophthora roreri MCA 2997]
MGLLVTSDAPHHTLFHHEEYRFLIEHVKNRARNHAEKEMAIVDQDLKDYIFKITNGHADAILTLLMAAKPGCDGRGLNGNGQLAAVISAGALLSVFSIT